MKKTINENLKLNRSYRICEGLKDRNNLTEVKLILLIFNHVFGINRENQGSYFEVIEAF